MRKIAGLTLALAALSAAAPAAAQNEFTAYDAAQATNLGERLVLCDLADQLSSGAPSRDAHRAFVRVEGSNRFELALPPDFTRPSGWYDYDIERAYDRYRRAGLVRREEVNAARERFRTPLRSRYHQISLTEQRFFQSQTRFCEELVRASYRR